MIRVRVSQPTPGAWLAARGGTPTIVCYGATEAAARAKAARQLRSYRRWRWENEQHEPR